MNPSAPAPAAASRTIRSDARGFASRMLSAIVPRSSVGCWGTHAICRRHASISHERRSTPPTRMRPPVGSSMPSRSAATVLFPAPLSPTSATVSPGDSSRSSPSSTGPGTGRVGERHVLEPDGGECGARSHQRSAVHGRCGRVEQREHPLRHRQPVRAGVELRPQPPQRQVQLGRQDDHGQPGLEPEAAVHEPHPGRHGDERDAERGRQLEHRPGQEADAQGLHGRRAIALADLADDARLILGAAERPQRRQAPYHVEEMRGQPRAARTTARASAARCSARSAT